jgi:prevent-host-death family protein
MAGRAGSCQDRRLGGVQPHSGLPVERAKQRAERRGTKVRGAARWLRKLTARSGKTTTRPGPFLAAYRRLTRRAKLGQTKSTPPAEAATRRVNIHGAKAHPSRLVDEAARGEPFVIAKAGEPVVKVVPFQPAETDTSRRLGFLKGADWRTPDDFDRFMQDETVAMFGDDESWRGRLC